MTHNICSQFPDALAHARTPHRRMHTCRTNSQSYACAGAQPHGLVHRHVSALAASQSVWFQLAGPTSPYAGAGSLVAVEDVSCRSTWPSCIMCDNAVMICDRTVMMCDRSVMMCDRTVMMCDRTVMMCDCTVMMCDRTVNAHVPEAKCREKVGRSTMRSDSRPLECAQ
jgi:hypothetical protein